MINTILKKIVKFNNLSVLMTGKEQNIRSDKAICKKYKKDYDDLASILEKWYKRVLKNRNHERL